MLWYAYVNVNLECASLTLPGGVVTYSCYDAVGRLTKLKSATKCGNNMSLNMSRAFGDLSRRSAATLRKVSAHSYMDTRLREAGYGDLKAY